jgi:hypothetical protein
MLKISFLVKLVKGFSPNDVISTNAENDEISRITKSFSPMGGVRFGCRQRAQELVTVRQRASSVARRQFAWTATPPSARPELRGGGAGGENDKASEGILLRGSHSFSVNTPQSIAGASDVPPARKLSSCNLNARVRSAAYASSTVNWSIHSCTVCRCCSAVRSRATPSIAWASLIAAPPTQPQSQPWRG